MIRLHITVSGKVQKVFFRHTAKKIADALALSGWVRNMPDESLLCEVQGERVLADQFIAFILHGPMLSEVRKVCIEFIPVIEKEQDFRITQ